MPVAALSDTLLQASRGFNTMRPLILVERIGRPIGQVLLTLVAIAVGTRTAGAFTSAWALPYVATAAVAVWWTLRLVRNAEHRAAHKAMQKAMLKADHGADTTRAAYKAVHKAERRPSARAETVEGGGFVTPRDYWFFTAPRGLQSIVQIALQRLDVVLVSAILGPAHAAIYAAVTRFLVFGQLGAQAITSAVQPQLGALLFSGDRKGAGRVYQVSTCWLVLLTWPLYLGLAVFSKQIPGSSSGTATTRVQPS